MEINVILHFYFKTNLDSAFDVIEDIMKAPPTVQP